MRGSFSLSLLEGLAHQSDASGKCVHEALSQYRAASTIAQWIERKKETTTTTTTTRRRRRRSSTRMNHWLIRGLTSSSLCERRVAARMMATGCPLDAHSLWTVMEMLGSFLVHQGSHEKNEVDPKAMVGLFALWKHCIEVGSVLHSPSWSLAVLHHPRFGLKAWMAPTLWEIAIHRHDSENHHGEDDNSNALFISLIQCLHRWMIRSGVGGRSEDTTATITQARNYFLWRETSTAGGAASMTTTSGDGESKKHPLSPLACLVGAHHLSKKKMGKHHDMISKFPKVSSKSQRHLSQLIDPATVTGGTSSSKQPPAGSLASVSSLWKLLDIKKSRLSDTMLGPAPPALPTSTSSPWKGKSKKQRTSSTGTSSLSQSHAALLAATRTSSATSAAATDAGGGATSTDQSTAATVARIFNAVYGTGSQEQQQASSSASPAAANMAAALPQLLGSEDLLAAVAEDDDDDSVEGEDEDVDLLSNNGDDEDVVMEDTDGAGSGGGGAIQDENDPKDNADDEDDEDIDSEDIGDDDDDDDDEDDDEEGVDVEEHEIVIHDEETMARIEQGLMDLNEIEAGGNPSTAPRSATDAPPKEVSSQRKSLFVQACMEVLGCSHPLFGKGCDIPLVAEKGLIQAILDVVKPTKKPLNSKLILRRTPTQEEFFRGNLSRNPVSFSMLRKDAQEPTVKDLRNYIANDLQMGDSAEMLELLVANKIVDVDLKLRVVNQVLWKEHLLQSNGASSSSVLSSFLGSRGGSRSFISTGSGLSMMFSSGLERSLAGGDDEAPQRDPRITPDTPFSSLPPMVITYRLTGVDGEATEDSVSTLQDPEAPSQTATSEEVEALLEKEFGVTRKITEGRGVFFLLHSLEHALGDTLRRIRRDDVGGSDNNVSRQDFKQLSSFPTLSLLQCCAKLPSNRKTLLHSRAPTILLRLLLDVLHAIEDDGKKEQITGNNVATCLQELIEVLASDILSSDEKSTTVKEIRSHDQDIEREANTLRLLLSAIETSFLSRPLRNVIAKLLPYLTYGLQPLSKELGLEFLRHVTVDRLSECEKEEDHEEMMQNRSILMQTFVHATCSLPANHVCDTLRDELASCGFLERVAGFILQSSPPKPAPWTTSLWAKNETLPKAQRVELEDHWRRYAGRPGIKTALNMIIGLAKHHVASQRVIAAAVNPDSTSLAQLCHWIEATSDNALADIDMKGLGLVAEMLLDELAESGPVSTEVKKIRKATRDRKKKIATERRSKALINMSNFHPAGSNPMATRTQSGTSTFSSRGTAAAFLAPVLGLFQQSHSESTDGNPPSAKRRRREAPKSKEEPPKPAWMLEMEALEDEAGLTCAVCQEGRTLQPSELLGIYAYVKKISLPLTQCGGRSGIEGITLLTTLLSLKLSSAVSDQVKKWFDKGKAAGANLKASSRNTSTLSSYARRGAYYTTTVTAGNAIHLSCHSRARQADRNHPKAPKSEWEGACLRNSRVRCNIIMPLVSSRISRVPLVAVDSALTDHQTAVSNLLGARPRSMLWNVLHDVRFLLLRMAYGESLNEDCDGGSLSSNAQLVFYQLLTAEMFEKDAEIDAPEVALHARCLSDGFLALRSMIGGNELDAVSMLTGVKALADASTMAALTCILFHNSKDEESGQVNESTPSLKRRWEIGKKDFLAGLFNCAGRRHALGVNDSGCTTQRNPSRGRSQSSGFVEWEFIETENEVAEPSQTQLSSTGRHSSKRKGRIEVDDFGKALRPMVVYYAMIDQISKDFTVTMDDAEVEDCANRLAEVVENCRQAKSISELLKSSGITMEHANVIDELQRGLMAA